MERGLGEGCWSLDTGGEMCKGTRRSRVKWEGEPWVGREVGEEVN